MRATISILGLTNFDDSIWEGFQVPEVLETHREDIIEEILVECSDFELLYPDWNVMKRAIGRWSRHELPIWERLCAIKAKNYDLLWDVDEHRIETRVTRDDGEHTENTQGNTANTGAKTNADTEALTENVDEAIDRSKDTDSAGTNRHTGTDTTTNTSSRDTDTLNKSNTFNAATMLDNSESIVDEDYSGTQNVAYNTTDTLNSTDSEEEATNRDLDRTQSINKQGREDTTESGTYAEQVSGTTANLRNDRFEVDRTGNTGRFTKQQILTEEWEVAQLDPEQYIIDSFKQQFCLLLY